MKLALVVILAMSTSAFARDKDIPQVHHNPPPPPPVRTFNIGPLELGGKVRVLAMLEFIERANTELERSALEKKSFIPKLVASLDEEAL
jgi:hypothetical protein